MTSKARVVRFISLTDKEKVIPFLENVRLYNGSSKRVESASDDIQDARSPHQREPPSSHQVSDPSVNSSRSCSYCQVQFEEVSDQRLHYKLDWHRYNIKQSLAGRRAVTEDEFEKQLQEIENDEENEISASDDSCDSEDEETREQTQIVQGARILFVSGTGQTQCSPWLSAFCWTPADAVTKATTALKDKVSDLSLGMIILMITLLYCLILILILNKCFTQAVAGAGAERVHIRENTSESLQDQ